MEGLVVLLNVTSDDELAPDAILLSFALVVSVDNTGADGVKSGGKGIDGNMGWGAREDRPEGFCHAKGCDREGGRLSETWALFRKLAIDVLRQWYDDLPLS